jgi:type VI secretion system secreted protein VgrG
VHNNRAIKVDGTHNETITKDTNITIEKGPYKLDVQANTHTHLVKGDVTETYHSNQQTVVNKNIFIQSETAMITVDAKTEIILNCGQSFFSMKVNISISADKQVQAGVATQTVTCDTSQVTTSGAGITASAVGVHNITGALVKIN